MEQLELKHIAPYLPYGLKLQYTHTKEVGILTNLYDIEENDNIKLSINYSDGEHIWMFKPILRPLSDLTKEIEVNGERFVPIECSDRIKTEYIEWKERGCRFGAFETYYVMEYMFKWHFDVFGLIEKGLAIDINTI